LAAAGERIPACGRIEADRKQRDAIEAVITATETHFRGSGISRSPLQLAAFGALQ
jgi:hypothetical protein